MKTCFIFKTLINELEKMVLSKIVEIFQVCIFCLKQNIVLQINHVYTQDQAWILFIGNMGNILFYAKKATSQTQVGHNGLTPLRGFQLTSLIAFM